jgi:hypothetical protein
METDMMLSYLHSIAGGLHGRMPELQFPREILAEDLEESERFTDPALRRMQVMAWAGSAEGEVIESAAPGAGVRPAEG